jgi:hypothetical protein
VLLLLLLVALVSLHNNQEVCLALPLPLHQLLEVLVVVVASVLPLRLPRQLQQASEAVASVLLQPLYQRLAASVVVASVLPLQSPHQPLEASVVVALVLILLPLLLCQLLEVSVVVASELPQPPLQLLGSNHSKLLLGHATLRLGPQNTKSPHVMVKSQIKLWSFQP